MYRCCSNCKYSTVIYENEIEKDETTGTENEIGYPSCDNPDSKNYQCYIPDDYVCAFFKEK